MSEYILPEYPDEVEYNVTFPEDESTNQAADDFNAFISSMSTGSPSRSTINETATPAEQRLSMVAAEGEPIRRVYGSDKLGPQIFAWGTIGDFELVLGLLWCEGPVASINIDRGEENETVPLDVQFSHHLGLAVQIPDPWLVAAIPGYHDPLHGMAYSVARIPAGSTNGIPQIRADINGLTNIYDPRTDTTGYRNNPTLVLAHFIEDTGLSMDWDSVATAADANDEQLGGIARNSIGLTMDRRADIKSWRETLSEYAECFVVPNGDLVKLVPNRPASVSRSITADDTVQGTVRPSRPKSMRDVPTVVRVVYTNEDRDGYDAAAYAPGVLEGTTPWRESLIRMPGIHRKGQALRLAIRRLNAAILSDLTVEWVSFDEGIQDQFGDVIELTDPIGLNAKQLRLLPVGMESPGRWRCRGLEYVEGMYSNTVTDDISPPDTDLPNPLNVKPVDAVTLTEELFTDQAGRTFSRMRAVWTGVAWPYVEGYRVTISGVGVALESFVIHRGQVEHAVVTGPVSDGQTYIVEVYTVGSLGNQATDPATDSETALGRQLPPGNVPFITGFEAGQFVYLEWSAVVDIGQVGYRIKRGATTDTWNTAPTLVANKIFVLSHLEPAVPAGTWRYFIRAVDDLGIESLLSTIVDIEVTADVSEAILRNSATLAGATLTNMHGYEIAGVGRYAVTDFGETMAARWPGDPAMNSLADKPLCLGHSNAGAAQLETAEWDIGHDRTGTWQINAMIDLIQTGAGVAASAKEIRLALAADYPTFTTYAGQTVQKPGRYTKAVIKEAGNGADAAIRVKFPIQQTVIGKLVRQTGTVNVPAAGQPATVTFTTPYATNPEIRLNLVGSTPRVIAADNVTPTSFDVYAWDLTPAAAAATVDWTAEGF